MEGVVYYIKTDKGIEGVDENTLREMAARNPEFLEEEIIAMNIASDGITSKVKDFLYD